MAKTPTIVAEDLHKYYGKIHALDGLDLVTAACNLIGGEHAARNQNYYFK